MRHIWVAPPFDGTPTGGTLYNAALCHALSRSGVACERVDIDEAFRALSAGSDDCGRSVQAQRYDQLFRNGFESGDTRRWFPGAPTGRSGTAR